MMWALPKTKAALGLGKLTWDNILSYLVVLLLPIVGKMLAIGFLIGVDFITGIFAAKKRGERITSRKMGRTIVKVLLYQLAILAAFTIESFLLPQLPFVYITIFFISTTEFFSVSENLTVILGLKVSMAKYVKEKVMDWMKFQPIT